MEKKLPKIRLPLIQRAVPLCLLGFAMLKITVLLSVTLNTACSPSDSPSTFNYPEPTVTTDVKPEVIDAGQQATIEVVIKGSHIVQTNPITASVVLALDESGSMAANNAYQSSRQAAIDFMQLLKSSDRLAIIAIKSSPNILVQPTTDKLSAIGVIQSLGGPGGATDIKGAFDATNQILSNEQSAIRMAIFLTDGLQAGAAAYIKQNITDATDHKIQYFTVGFGNYVDSIFLSDLAQETGGTYSFAGTDATLLSAFFQNIFKFNENALHLRDVSITEALSPGIELIPESFSSSFPPSLLIQLASAVSAFETSSPHTTNLPTLYAMTGETTHTFNFKVTVSKCTNVEQTYDVHDINASVVSFTSNAGGGPFKLAFPDPNDPNSKNKLTVRPCGIGVNKTFDDGTSKVKIEIKNGFQVPVYDVIVQEVPTRFFTAAPATSVPQASSLPIGGSLSGVVWALPKIEAGDAEFMEVQVLPTCDALKEPPGPLPVNPMPTTADLSIYSYKLERLLMQIAGSDPMFHVIRQALISGASGAVDGVNVVYDFVKQQGLLLPSNTSASVNIVAATPTQSQPSDIKWALEMRRVNDLSIIQRLWFGETSEGINVYRTVMEEGRLQPLNTRTVYDRDFWAAQASLQCP
jgi:hypothetical protein